MGWRYCVYYRIYGTIKGLHRQNERDNRLYDVLWTSLDQYLCSYTLSNAQIIIINNFESHPRPHPRGRVTGREKGRGLLAVRYLEVKLY